MDALVVKGKIVNLLMECKRMGMDELILHMDASGFFEAPCSGQYHLSREGGLAEHSLNVYNIATDMLEVLVKEEDRTEEFWDAVTITTLLHDLGKMGQFEKVNYIPNMLVARATKANPNPEPYQSPKKPYITNPDLLYVDHEIRSLQIASKYIDLTEEESFAILYHNGMYGNLKYAFSGKETPLSLLVHFADMWASRVTEVENTGEEVGE